MKNNILFQIIIISVFLFNSFAQKHQTPLLDKKATNLSKSNELSSPLRTIKSYQIEENINMNFGGYTTKYTVSDSSLINTNDLGPNNTRVIKEQFIVAKPPKELQIEPITDSVKPNLKISILKPADSSKRQDEYAYVFMIKTYERIAEKGYKSLDIFQKLGNSFYFSDEPDKAAKWYKELFAMTSDLGAEYYYRYSYCLKAIGQSQESNEMLEKFNKLSGNNSSK